MTWSIVHAIGWGGSERCDTQRADAPMLRPGDVLKNRYRLDEVIGTGGMGQVWLAFDRMLKRGVAVKVMLSSYVEERGRGRFLHEARTMAQISHPGVVTIHDCDIDDGIVFIVMEYVRGEPLSSVLARQSTLSPSRTLPIILQVAEALQAAHDKKVVHRDIKPANLILAGSRVKVTDFGIALSAGATRFTDSNAVLASFHYISPEQANSEDASPRSDIYSLGVVAYECLSGRTPFLGNSPLELAMCHLRERPPPLPESVPWFVRDIVTRAMAKNAGDRYGSARDLATGIRAALRQLRSVDPPETSATRHETVGNQSHATRRTEPIAAYRGQAVANGSGPTRMEALPSSRRGLRLRILGAVTVGLVVLLGATLWFTNRGDVPAAHNQSPSSELPRDLREFAADWPVDRFRPDGLTPEEANRITERWKIESDEQADPEPALRDMSIFIVRFKVASPNGRDTVRRGLPAGTKLPITLAQPATYEDASGRRGRYVEYETTLANGRGQVLGIWWDASLTDPAGLVAMLFMTPVTPNPPAALNRLRGAWSSRPYRKIEQPSRSGR